MTSMVIDAAELKKDNEEIEEKEPVQDIVEETVEEKSEKNSKIVF